MKAYHGKQKIKDYYLARVKAHQLADEIVKGKYWENGKGCAVGCTLHSDKYAAYETELGIPQVLARLEDIIFENLPNELSKTWPYEFLDAINVGADLSNVWPQFALWLLTDNQYGILNFAKDEKIKNIIIKVADGYKNYSITTIKEWEKIIKEISADYAFSSYFSIHANATHAAAYAAKFAADAAADAVVNASDAAAYVSCVSYDNYYLAKINHFKAQAVKLLQLLKEAIV